jgi:hypothetical protein
VITAEKAADKKLNGKWPHCVTKGFDGFYVASWEHGAHTGGEVWLYAEAPVGSLDQGPLALWTAASPEGPFTFKALRRGLPNMW